MDILIVSEDFEVLKDFIARLKFTENLGQNYARFRYQEAEFDILLTGYGGNLSMYSIAQALAHKDYDAVIHFGQCYSLKDPIEKNQLVYLIDDYFGDHGRGSSDHFQSLFELGLRSKEEEPFRNEMLENNTPIPRLFRDIRKVSGITCNSIPVSIQEISNAYLKNHPDVISREAANILYACLKEKIKIVQLLYVIDRLENAGREDYIPDMRTTVNKILDKILEEKLVLN